MKSPRIQAKLCYVKCVIFLLICVASFIVWHSKSNTVKKTSLNLKNIAERSHYQYDTQDQQQEALNNREGDGVATLINQNVPQHINEFWFPGAEKALNIDKFNASEILEIIENENQEQKILNEDLFPEPLKMDSVIILVQVHDRIEYLRYLINSLAKVRGISEILLIFSHDIYSDEINAIVRAIVFCKVLQIFYPHSIQTHKHVFPGDDSGDCPSYINHIEADKRKCKYLGYERKANVTQIKHHWWWKANRVFDQLRITENHTGLVLLMEADNYIAEDALHMLNLMKKEAESSCPDCDVFSVGGKHDSIKYYPRFITNHVKVSMWEDNLGFAFNRTTWHKIARCASTFCTYNDYNWDFSLQHVCQKCLEANNKLYQIYLTRARIFHIGVCGFHVHHNDCNPKDLITMIENQLKIASDSKQTFPNNLKIVQRKIFHTRYLLSNGGWNDERDHQFCLNMTTIVRTK